MASTTITTTKTTLKLIVSRRSLINLSRKYPYLTNKPSSNSSKSNSAGGGKKEESPWPRSLQIVGYTAIGLAVPYSAGTAIAESPRLRSWLEGDDDENDQKIGRKVVRWVRWFWGHEEEIPYYELLLLQSDEDKKNRDVSLGNDVPSKVRSEQCNISRALKSQIGVRMAKVGSGNGDDGVIVSGRVPGHKLVNDYSGIWNAVSEGNTKNIKQDNQRFAIWFKDDEEEGQSGELQSEGGDGSKLNSDDAEFIFGEERRGSAPGEDMRKLTAIWSTWNYFPSNDDSISQANSTKSVTSSANAIANDATQIKIDELEWNISELQKSLNDPMCTRDRDDMEQDLKQNRKELSRLRRERSFGRLKNLLSF